MKEIEILVKVDDSKEMILQSLDKFTHHGIKRTIDIYFYDPLRVNLQPGVDGKLRSSFRVRDQDGLTSLAYKIDNFNSDDKWIYSDEHETTVGNFETLLHIIENLGFQELIRIDNEKHIFTTSEYEIVFEDVKNLGFFLEVEKLHEVSDIEVLQVKKEIDIFIRELGLHTSEELNAGKPELMLAKK